MRGPKDACRAMGGANCFLQTTPAGAGQAPIRPTVELIRSACERDSGVFDKPADLQIAQTALPSADVPIQGADVASGTHSCSTAAGLTLMRVMNLDTWAPVVRGNPSLPGFLMPRRQRFPVLTGVFVLPPERVVAGQRRIALEKQQREQITCAMQTMWALNREGTETTQGLIVERRERVVLVQPDKGTARWVSVDGLKLKAPLC